MTMNLSADRVQRAIVSIALIEDGVFVREPGEPLPAYAWRVNERVDQSPRYVGALRALRQAMKSGLEPEPIVLIRDVDGDLEIADGVLRTAAAAMIGRTKIAAIIYTPTSVAEADFVGSSVHAAAEMRKPQLALLRAIARVQ
jgi:hypothetical protein